MSEILHLQIHIKGDRNLGCGKNEQEVDTLKLSSEERAEVVQAKVKSENRLQGTEMGDILISKTKVLF